MMSLVVPPYPEPRYLEDQPEVSAWIKRADDPPDYETFGVKYHYLANQQATGGDYGLYRVDIAANGGGPGPHFHRAMSEAFFVLSGTMKLYDGNEWLDSHQGDFLFVPPAAGGLLRRVFGAGRHDRRRTPGVVHPPRQFFRSVAVRSPST
jgi:mannose-6-phosphate isomerase-like protein (cupin superfamily)